MSNSTQAPDQLPWDPNCTRFPLLKELPRLPNAPEGAAWVWGKDDQVCVHTSRLLAITLMGIAREIEPLDAAACQGISQGDSKWRHGATGVSCIQLPYQISTLILDQSSSKHA